MDLCTVTLSPCCPANLSHQYGDMSHGHERTPMQTILFHGGSMTMPTEHVPVSWWLEDNASDPLSYAALPYAGHNGHQLMCSFISQIQKFLYIMKKIKIFSIYSSLLFTVPIIVLLLPSYSVYLPKAWHIHNTYVSHSNDFLFLFFKVPSRTVLTFMRINKVY